MKTLPNQTAFESAPDKRDYTPGTLPKQQDTVTAAVLAAMLESEVITGMESVFKQSTTRLSAVIYYLERKYGWHAERRDIAKGTSDGRVATVTAYWLPRGTIALSFEAGAREWIDNVKAARLDRRKLSDKCKADAAKWNARKFKAQDPRQGGLWS